MAIPPEVIEEIRARADLVDIVGEVTPLRRVGRSYRGPCPLHRGDGPNFSIDPARGLFKCFVCGEGGDVFAFLQKLHGWTFAEAVRALAERVGVPLPEDRPAGPDPRAPLFEAVALAVDWYARQLASHPEAARARAWLRERRLKPELVERARLGYAPADGQALRRAAQALGIGDDVLRQAGLLVATADRPPRDLFRDRLLFPIDDAAGRPVAFGGRALRDGVEPKYLNSPETPIFRKGRLLYGLAWAKGPIRREGVAIVVEGYVDCLALHGAGWENAVAPLGTALTPEQARLLARLAERVILLYDGDAAGLRAAFRAADALLPTGREVLVATLPPGEDPDSYLRTHGRAALERILADAVDVLERKLQILRRRGYFDSIAGTRRAVDKLLPTVRLTGDPVLRELYLERIATAAKLPVERLREELQARPRGPRPEVAPAPSPVDGAERELLALLLAHELWVEQAAQRIEPALFRSAPARELYEALLLAAAQGGRDPDDAWARSLSPAAQALLESLRRELAAVTSAAAQVFEDAVRRLRARPLEERLAAVEAALREAPDEAARERLMHEKKTLVERMHAEGLGDRRWRAVLHPDSA